MVRLTVFDLLGREVSTLVNEVLTAGEHSVEFNTRNLSSGVYFYRLIAPGFLNTKPMLLMK